MGNVYLGDKKVASKGWYLGDSPLFEEEEKPSFPNIDNILPDPYATEDCHVFVASRTAIYLPIPNGTLPTFVAVNGVDVTPTSFVASPVAEGEEEEPQVVAAISAEVGDIIHAIFDWDNANAQWMNWFADILQFGLNSETGERNQLKSAYKAFRKMPVNPSLIKDLDVSNNVTFEEMFIEASKYNDDISEWNTSNVNNMTNMFKQATSFNQDLSEWCVPAVKHDGFDDGATSWTLPNSRPVWGTCPRGEDGGVVFPIEIDGVTYTKEDCHIFVVNGLDRRAGLPIERNVDPILYLVNGKEQLYDPEGRYQSGTVITAIFDWRNQASQEQDWYSDILQFGSRSVGDEPPGYENPPALASGRIPNQLKEGIRGFYKTQVIKVDAIENLDVSNLQDMTYIFYYATWFNSDISNWDTSNVENLGNAFRMAESFAGNLSTWDVSKAARMESMFHSCIEFNSDISEWNTAKVTNMTYMFYKAKVFNQDLSQWCVSEIPFRPSYFDNDASAWRLPKPQWGTCPRAENIDITLPDGYELPDCHTFVANGKPVYLPIPSGSKPIFVAYDGVDKTPTSFTTQTIDVEEIGADGKIVTTQEEVQIAALPTPSSGTTIHAIFDWDNGTAIRQDWYDELLNIGLNSATGKRNQLKNASNAFVYVNCKSSAITRVDLSNVTNLYGMFKKSTNLPTDIENLNVSRAQNMNSMFQESTKNPDISGWDVSTVRSMSSMFYNASNFNQNLSAWCVLRIPNEPPNFKTGANSWVQPQPPWGKCGDFIPDISVTTPDMKHTAKGTFTIQNYDSKQTYHTSMVSGGGSANIAGDQITLTSEMPGSQSGQL